MPSLRRLLCLGIAIQLGGFCDVSLASKYEESDAPKAVYGWIPEYKKLYARLGVDFLSSSENFASDGVLDALPNNGALNTTMFWIEPEYGIAQDWSVKLFAGYLTSSISGPAAANGANNTLFSNSGLSDIRTDVKWNVKVSDPIITTDIIFQFPVASTAVVNQGDLALGDGSFNVGLQLHAGQRTGPFLLALSPGFLYRSNGFSPEVIADAAFQVDFMRGYVRVFGNFVYSITQPASTAGNPAAGNPAPGSGGSFAVLAEAPLGLALGGKIGIKIYENLYLEGGVSHAVWGNRYPNFLNITVNLFNSWDFFKPMNPKKVREVPFDETGGSDFYKGK